MAKMKKGMTRRRREGVTTILLSHLFQNCLFMYPVFKDTCQRNQVSTFSSGAFDFTRLGICKEFRDESTVEAAHILNDQKLRGNLTKTCTAGVWIFKTIALQN